MRVDLQNHRFVLRDLNIDHDRPFCLVFIKFLRAILGHLRSLFPSQVVQHKAYLDAIFSLFSKMSYAVKRLLVGRNSEFVNCFDCQYLTPTEY